MTTMAPPVQQADTVFMAKPDTVDAPGDVSAGTGAINVQASGYEFSMGVKNNSGLDSVNPLGWTKAPGVFSFKYTDNDYDEAAEAAKPLDFHQYNMHPASHGMHPSQRVEIETVVVGEDREEAFKAWTSKEFSKGAEPKTYPYKRGKEGFAEGYSGYKPLWYAAHQCRQSKLVRDRGYCRFPACADPLASSHSPLLSSFAGGHLTILSTGVRRSICT